MIKIGWKAGTEQYQPQELLRFGIEAEAQGFDSIDISDHFHPWSEVGAAPFTWIVIGGMIARTKHIEIGTGLTCPILRYHPAIIAQAAATAAYMSNNRFYLGVGTGEALNEYAAIGEWPGYATRRDMLAEAIMLIRELWTGEEITFVGDYYQTKKARLYTLPDKPIPIYISSLVQNSAYFAGKYGDGLITVSGKKPEVYNEMLAHFSDGAKKAGKNPNKMPKMIEVNAAFTDDKKATIESVKKYWAGTYIPALFDQKIYTPKMSAQNGEAVGADTIEGKMCISANVSDHLDFLNQYIDFGFTDINIHSPGPDQLGFIKNYGENVLKRLKKSASQHRTYTTH